MSATPFEETPERASRGPLVKRIPRPALHWLWWAPVALGGIYVVLILASLRRILDSVWLSSDADIDAVLAHMSIHAPSGALLTTGDYAHYETIAFTLLTRSWPLYRELWVLAPVFFAVVGLAAVLWSTARAFGRWPAAMVGAALVCFGGGGIARAWDGGLATIFATDAHANTLITAACVGAALVWIVPRVAILPNDRLMAAAIGLGFLGGLPLAGDSLYLAWGVAPLVAVTVLAAWRGPQDGARRVVAFGLGTLACTYLTAFVFAAVMHGDGIRAFGPSHRGFLTFATPHGLITNLTTLLKALPMLTAGDFYGKLAGVRAELQFVSAALLFAALVAAIWSVRRRVENALPRVSGGGDVVGERFVHTTYWITVLGAGLTVFMIGTPNPFTTDGRYLLGPYVAVAALLPLMLERGLGWKLIVSAGVSLYAFSAIYQFGGGVKEMAHGYETAGVAHALAAYARKEDVAVGYGYYWNSIDLMWESDFKVKVYPIQRCKHNGAELCTFREISISSWDRPIPNVRSMLVANPTAAQVRAPEAAFGTPLATQRIGNLEIYVYPYDIATKLGHEAGLTL